MADLGVMADLGMMQLIFVVGLAAIFVLFRPVRNFFFEP